MLHSRKRLEEQVELTVTTNLRDEDGDMLELISLESEMTKWKIAFPKYE